MATATATKPTDRTELSKSPVWGAPVDITEHEAQMQKRAEAQAKNRLLHQRCLNPDIAAQMEARKPLYEWTVKATYMAENSTTGIRESRTEERVVLAQNESDAWAKFGDQLGFGLAPKSCEREIKQGTRVN